MAKNEPTGSATEAQIEAWFRANFTGNRISADELDYNLAFAAKEELKRLMGFGVQLETAESAPADKA
jgi:hypothetical protein